MLSDNASIYKAGAAELAGLINLDRMVKIGVYIGHTMGFHTKNQPLGMGILDGLTKMTLRNMLGKAHAVTLPEFHIF